MSDKIDRYIFNTTKSNSDNLKDNMITDDELRKLLSGELESTIRGNSILNGRPAK